MKKILYFLFALPLVLAGCYEDKSSVSDKTIGIISIEGIDESYTKTSFEETLDISPTVTSTDPNDRLEYLWTIYDAGINETGSDVPVDTIGREKDLEWPVALKPGKYTVRLRVTNVNIEPNYVVTATTTLNTNTAFTTGWYFLKETASGNTEMDFRNPEGDILPDLIEQAAGSPIEGKPVRLGYFLNYSYIDPGTPNLTNSPVLVPMGGKDLKMLRVDDMALIYDHQTMFYGDIPDEIPLMAIGDGMDTPMYISSKGTYSTSQLPYYGTLGTGKYGFATVPEGSFSYSKHMVVPLSGLSYYFNTALFDEINGRFVWVNYRNQVATLSWDEEEDGGIKPYDIPHKLLFMSYTHYGFDASWNLATYGKAVFQDATNSAQRYVYNLNVGAVHNPIGGIIPIDPSLNFARAQVYSTNKTGSNQLMYGGVDDKLYVYNTESDTETLLAPKGMESGWEITMLSFKYDLTNDLLAVATHKDGKYKVYMYTTIDTGEAYGDPLLVAEGVGKVVDLQYAAPGRMSNYDVNF